MKRLLLPSLLILGVCLFGFEQSAQAQYKAVKGLPESVYLGPKYPSDTYLGANTKGALTFTYTDAASAGGAELVHFIHLNPRTVLLTQFSGALGEEGFGILSGGLGVRRLLPDEQTFVGLNAFYDYLRDQHDFSYSQVGFGAEISRGRFTLRGNYYLPVGDNDGTFSTGNHFYTVEANESWDAELEVALFKQAHFIDPYIAVGYYSVSGNDADISGLKLRGEVRVGQYVNLGAEWRQDCGDIDQEWRFGVRFEFPIGKAPAATQALPVRAVADGKSVRPLQSEGKSFKQSLSLEQPLLPPQFLAPVKRSPWPNGIYRQDPKNPNDPDFAGNDCHCRDPIEY